MQPIMRMWLGCLFPVLQLLKGGTEPIILSMVWSQRWHHTAGKVEGDSFSFSFPCYFLEIGFQQLRFSTAVRENSQYCWSKAFHKCYRIRINPYYALFVGDLTQMMLVSYRYPRKTFAHMLAFIGTKIPRSQESSCLAGIFECLPICTGGSFE